MAASGVRRAWGPRRPPARPPAHPPRPPPAHPTSRPPRSRTGRRSTSPARSARWATAWAPTRPASRRGIGGCWRGLRQAGGGGGAVRARTRALAARLLGQPFTPSSPPTHPQSTEQTWQCVQHVLEAHAKAAKHFRVKVGRLGWPAGALGKGPAARPLRRCAAAPRTLDPRPGFQPNPGPEPGPNPDLEPDRATPHLTLPLPTFAHVQVPGGKLSMNLDGEWGEPFTGSDADKASGGVRGWEGWGWRRGARSAPSEASRAGALLGPAPTPSHCPPPPPPYPPHPSSCVGGGPDSPGLQLRDLRRPHLFRQVPRFGRQERPARPGRHHARAGGRAQGVFGPVFVQRLHHAVRGSRGRGGGAGQVAASPPRPPSRGVTRPSTPTPSPPSLTPPHPVF